MHGVLAQESGPIRAVFGSFESMFLWVTMGVSLIALLFAYYLVREVLGAPEGTEKMKEIAKAIQEGAKAYLSRQFRTLAVFLGILTVEQVEANEAAGRLQGPRVQDIHQGVEARTQL